jgi:hypothetical protein
MTNGLKIIMDKLYFFLFITNWTQKLGIFLNNIYCIYVIYIFIYLFILFFLFQLFQISLFSFYQLLTHVTT